MKIQAIVNQLLNKNHLLHLEQVILRKVLMVSVKRLSAHNHCHLVGAWGVRDDVAFDHLTVDFD